MPLLVGQGKARLVKTLALPWMQSQPAGGGFESPPAMALASMVLPVPGGPTKSTPLGSFPPRVVNLWGSLRYCTTSSSSACSRPEGKLKHGVMRAAAGVLSAACR